MPYPALVTSPNVPDQKLDLWLPERMAAVGYLLEGEKRIYNDYEHLLDEFFDAIRTNVLNPLAIFIDPFGVFRGLAKFSQGLTDFLTGGVTWVLRTAFERVLGAGYPFSDRAFVIRHLEEVRNRMVRTPDEVFDLVRTDVEQGTGRGESIPQMAARIEETLLRTGSERWVNRGVVVARTEALSAYNGGTYDAFDVMREEMDFEFEKVWLATMDPRTRDTHFAADGQRVPFAQPFMVGGFPANVPGDPTLPARERIQCRCSFLVVEPGEDVDMAGRGWKTAAQTDAEVARRAGRGIIRAGDQRRGAA